MNTTRLVIACVAVVVTTAGQVQPALAATISTVPVGNAGNTGELSGAGAGGAGPDAIVGDVAYKYRIGTTEVTNAQYVDFLNAKAISDPLGLYGVSSRSGTNPHITRTGTSGNYGYETAARDANKPVNYVSWYDAARFANWLHNGQGSGDTETGAYTLLGGTPIPSNGATITRNPSARWFIPSEDEWYKAAYHRNDETGGYFDYPTSSNRVPYELPPPGFLDNSANYSFVGVGLTNVGAYTDTTSPYGAFDMAGNVAEWNETLINGTPSERGMRGSAYDDSPIRFLEANNRTYYYPGAAYEGQSVGFRVATIPEPNTGVLAIFGCGTVWWSTKRRRRYANNKRNAGYRRRIQDASTVIFAKRYPALALLLLLFGIAGRLDAATVGVSSVNVDSTGNELLGFETGLGGVYSQSDLIQPTLTEFRGNLARTILVGFDGGVPAAGNRSLLLTHDFLLDTGIINSGIGATAATLQFSPALINGPGPDLVMFESDSSTPNDFVMQINGSTVTYLGATYNDLLLDADQSIDAYSRDAGAPENISQLENDSYSTFGAFSENVFGIAIDLDDFGVASRGMVSTVHFGSVGEIGSNTSFDPVLFMGIRSATVPEPSAVAFFAIAVCGIAGRRRCKRAA